ncbi:SET domain-containing protein [Lentithecium fluviatile CBS 122367]|uniref:SET domain-containing protein n=1 Tax=Lentithecium fluviatile CBS 122367 TaxID=1168545 RepID=A0A6G1IQQ5_9PLEO|nr:SET domain-containing protein [Lentithecium fluviatile CBS 122367]
MRIEPITRGGHGVFASTSIFAHTIMGEYTGELHISHHRVSDEASSYWTRIPMGQQRPTWQKGGQKNCEIDGARKGSAWRFLNHSCEPNAVMVIGRVGNSRRVKGVKSLREIKVGEEIIIDYGKGWVRTMKGCWCKSEKCVNPMDGKCGKHAERPVGKCTTGIKGKGGRKKAAGDTTANVGDVQQKRGTKRKRKETGDADVVRNRR